MELTKPRRRLTLDALSSRLALLDTLSAQSSQNDNLLHALHKERMACLAYSADLVKEKRPSIADQLAAALEAVMKAEGGEPDTQDPVQVEAWARAEKALSAYRLESATRATTPRRTKAPRKGR